MPPPASRVYLDHAASSPMPPAVREAYLEAAGRAGNPSSLHGDGQAARDLVETGREAVARSLGADPVEVVFTGGGTEAVNLALKGSFWARAPRRRILTTRAEHHATLDAVEWLAGHEGALVDWLDVDADARVSLDALEQSLDRGGDDIAMVSLLWANNEVGTLTPVAEVVELAHRFGVPVHLDAIAAYGAVPIDVHALGVDLVSVSAHKIGGPVGSGALVVARSARLEPLVHGGAQQPLRSGTLDAAGASAFGVAASLIEPGASRLAELRARLVAGLSALPGVVLRGDQAPDGHVPGIVNATFAGASGETLLYLLDAAGYSVSTGSACTAGVADVSHVLLATGVPEEEARGALRFSLHRDTPEAAIDGLLAALPDALARARAASVPRS